MRVLMVSSNWPPASGGGAEAYVADLTAALRETGHVVGAVTLGITGDDVVATVTPRPHRLNEHGASSAWRKALFHGADVWRPDVTRTLQRAVERFRPDVVHTHVVAGMSVTALTAPSRIGVPHVHTLHDHWLRCWRSTGTTAQQLPCGPACTAVERFRMGALRGHGPDVVIGISQSVLSSHRWLHLQAPHAVVIRHPAETIPAAAPVPRHGPPVFGFLGQLNPNKGVSVFLGAARRMSASGMRFIVAGRGRLQAEVAAAGIDGLEYRGWVGAAEKEQFFRDIHCLVVPSLWQEPAGLVVREAAARGIPVIASDVGGLPEYVPSSCRPLLFTPGDVIALELKMQLFAATPEAFRVDPAEAGSWPEHLGEVIAAYDTARSFTPVAA